MTRFLGSSTRSWKSRDLTNGNLSGLGVAQQPVGPSQKGALFITGPELDLLPAMGTGGASETFLNSAETALKANAPTVSIDAMTFRGVWSNANSYAISDCVIGTSAAFQGDVYRALSAQTAGTVAALPAHGAGSNAAWELVCTDFNLPTQTAIPHLGVQNCAVTTNALCSALKWKRYERALAGTGNTGDANRLSRLQKILKALPGTEQQTAQILNIVRQLYAYCMIADMIQFDPTTVCANGQTWGTWLGGILDTIITAEPNSNINSIHKLSRYGGHNQGNYARSSWLAILCYAKLYGVTLTSVTIDTEVTECVALTRLVLGDTSQTSQRFTASADENNINATYSDTISLAQSWNPSYGGTPGGTSGGLLTGGVFNGTNADPNLDGVNVADVVRGNRSNPADDGGRYTGASDWGQTRSYPGCAVTNGSPIITSPTRVFPRDLIGAPLTGITVASGTPNVGHLNDTPNAPANSINLSSTGRPTAGDTAVNATSVTGTYTITVTGYDPKTPGNSYQLETQDALLATMALIYHYTDKTILSAGNNALARNATWLNNHHGYSATNGNMFSTNRHLALFLNYLYGLSLPAASEDVSVGRAIAGATWLTQTGSGWLKI